MSDTFQYIDVDDEQFEDAPRALRDAYAKLKKKAQEQDAELSSFRSERTQATAADVLKAKGYDPKAAKFLTQAGIDLSNEGQVDAWLAEDGAFFKVGDAPQSEAPAEQTAGHQAEAAARQQLATAQSYVQPAAMDKMKAALSEIGPDATTEEVKAIYKKYGI